MPPWTFSLKPFIRRTPASSPEHPPSHPLLSHAFLSHAFLSHERQRVVPSPGDLLSHERERVGPTNFYPTSAFAANLLAFHPDPTQASILDSHSPRLLLCSTRQWGKSTVTAIKALHFALAHPKSTTLIAAPGLRQASEFLAKAAAFLEILEIPRRTDRRNSRSLLLPNSARLVAIPANQTTTRGFSPHLLIFDEAAFVPDSVYHALLPSLAATHGHLWLLSTPNGQSGFFYHAWHNESEWSRFQVKAADCPRITEDFLDEQRLLLGETRFNAEFHCEFSAGPRQLFPRDLIRRAIDPSLTHWEICK